jgi:hypothetical protein
LSSINGKYGDDLKHFFLSTNIPTQGLKLHQDYAIGSTNNQIEEKKKKNKKFVNKYKNFGEKERRNLPPVI